MSAYPHGRVVIEPVDKKAVTLKFKTANVVAVTLLDGQVKILKNRMGFSGQSIPQHAFEKDFANIEGVWLLEWWEANRLLKGLVSL